MDEKEQLEKIKQQITLEQVFNLLASWNAEPILKDNIIISRTICHCGQQHKLYYYNNTRLFRCYTECSTTFDIFELTMKVLSDNKVTYQLPQAINYVCNFCGIEQENKNFFDEQEELQDWKILNKYAKILNKENNKKEVQLSFYDKNILNFLPHPHILPWEKEGISKEIIKTHNICYNPSSQGIVIPHYDENNNLVGIRERTLIQENEVYGKYRPMYLNHTLYNHPLGFNLYNLNFSKQNIQRIKKAIVFESEKSCLLYASYFGEENDISVAVCGSTLSQYQVQLLLNLGVEEIIIAFDRQYIELGDKEHLGWVKKLKEINKKYSKYTKISYIFDKENLLGYKDSPIDCQKEKFILLYNKRFSI